MKKRILAIALYAILSPFYLTWIGNLTQIPSTLCLVLAILLGIIWFSITLFLITYLINE